MTRQSSIAVRISHCAVAVLGIILSQTQDGSTTMTAALRAGWLESDKLF